MVTIAFRVGAQFYIFSSSLAGAKRLFNAMLFTVLRTPLRWIDTVPLGRIINRFTADFDVLDYQIADELAWLCGDLFRFICVFGTGFVLTSLS